MLTCLSSNYTGLFANSAQRDTFPTMAYLDKLRHLLAELASNPFYRGRLPRDVASLDEFRENVGFTTKDDIVADCRDHPPYGTNLTYPIERYCRFCQSSGSTAGPLPTLDTPESWDSMLDVWDEVYRHAGVERGQTVFFAFSFGPFLGFWTAFEAATRRGNIAIPGGGLSSQGRLKLLARYGAQALCCTPTYAIRLGEVLADEPAQIRDSIRIRRILVAGEPGGSIPATRARIEALWPGAKVWDHHGMTEVGPVSYQIAEKPECLLVHEDAFFAEVLDSASLTEVDEGNDGELVLTTLNRIARPLVRFRTGDVVHKSRHRGQLCLEGGILGRADDMTIVRGVNIYPAEVERIVRQFDEVVEFQVIETTRDAMAELEVVIEPKTAEAGRDLAENVQNALANAFSLRIPVKLAEAGELPRFEFKSQRWVKA